MTTRRMLKRLSVAALVSGTVLAWLLARGTPARTAPPAAADDPWKDIRYLGADTCKRCHSTPTTDKPDFVLLTEYTTWKTEDRHAIAYAVLEGKRGRRMGELLAGDPKFVLKPEAGCLACHSMHFPGRTGEKFSPKDGVSCDGCHGPSEKWLTPHFALKNDWRKKTPADKFKLGMRDLRNPQVRAQLCSSCHIGNAEEGKVVTHVMYAAGHPPLNGFEVATFSRNEPQHWYDLKDVPLFKKEPAKYKDLYHLETAPFQNTRLVVVGSGLALREQMNLIAGRVRLAAKWPELELPALRAFKDKPAEVWPEAAMAHSDCAACHHELRVPSWRQERGFGLVLRDGSRVRSVPGRIQARLWPLPLFEISLLETGGWDPALRTRLEGLYATCNAQPFGRMAPVGDAAVGLRDWSETVIKDRLDKARFDRSAALRLLKLLCATAPARTPDFDEARLIVSAFSVVYGEWAPRDTDDARLRAVLTKLEEELDVHSADNPYKGLAKRRELVRDQLEKLAGKPLRTQKAVRQALAGIDDEKEEELRKTLLAPSYLAKLQELRDEDLALNLKLAGKYDPVVFKRRLAELGRLVEDLSKVEARR